VAEKDRYILAIDLGTSGPKVALITTHGEVVAHAFEENTVNYLPGGGAEQDPEQWWQTIKIAAKRALAEAAVPAARVIGVNCTTQWSGTVAVDAAGAPLADAIIWMDTRGARHIDSVAGGLVKIEGYGALKLMNWIRKTSGIPTRSGKDPIAHILFLKNERPEIYRAADKFLEPKDFINLRLTGKVASSADAIALHWVANIRDVNDVRYDDQLLRQMGVERGKLPDLRPVNSVLGPLLPAVAEELGLLPETPVVMGTPDVQSAAVGSGAVRDFEGHIYVGTSSWLTCHVPFKKTDIFHNMASLPAAIPGRYFIANEQETAGACLTFLRDNVLYHKDELLQEAALPDVYKIFDQIAARVPAGSDGVIFTPWLYGERSPVDDHTVRAALFNLSMRTTREQIIRAFFEGVAFNTRWLLGYVERFIGRRFDHLNFIGGGANSEVWCQIFADVCDRPIRQVKDPIHCNARGVAFLAAAALGEISYDQIGERTAVNQTFTPQAANRSIYDELFAAFVHIYKSNKALYAKLNAH